MSESATADSAPLSVEQAIASLTPEPAEQEANAWGEKLDAAIEKADAAVSGEENTEGEASSPEEASDEGENPVEETEAEAEPEAVAPVEPPKYWSQDAKAKFAALDPELQAVVLAQEGPREEAAAKAKAEAAEKVKAAEAELGKVGQLAEVLAERVPQWVKAFESRWGTQTPDWVAFAQEHGVETMTLTKLQFDTEQQQLGEAAKAQQIAQTQAHEAFVKAEFAKLAEIAPELAHPETGAAKRTEVSQYLAKQGIPPEAVQNISATEMSMAHKAMLWDQAQTKLSVVPKPKPTAPGKPASVRPAAAQAQSPAQRTAKEVVGRFHAKPSIENAVAMLLAKKA
jgi:hypothetical protein